MSPYGSGRGGSSSCAAPTRGARARTPGSTGAGWRGGGENDPDGTVRRAQGIRGRRRRDRGDPEGRRRAAVAPRRASAPGGVEREVVKGKPVRSLTRHLLAAAAAAFLLLPPHVFPSPARPAVVSAIPPP